MGNKGRVRVAVVGGLLGLAGVSGCSSTPGVPGPAAGSGEALCPAKPHGALCIRLFHTGATVTDAVAYLSATDLFLVGKTWRLVLTSYPCNPGTGPTTGCNPTGVFPGPTRHGLPPLLGFCRNPATGATTTVPPGCHDSLATEMATHGDWTGFALGQAGGPTYRSRTWLCVSEQLLTGGSWRPLQPPFAPTPVRACSSVGPT